MAIKPKKYLLDNGHIAAITRGRLSREHIAIIEKAVANGVAIEGYSVSKATAPVKDEGTAVEKPVTVVRDSNENAGVLETPQYTRDESYWQAHVMDDGKRTHVGMRTVCNVCNNSLTFCYCRTPVVNLDHKRTGLVMFSPKG